MNKIEFFVMQFEEFFAEKHREDLFEILDAYPKKRSIIINYDDLEMFDPDLADLLIEKPEEIIDAAKNAIKNIDPLVKDADINPRFINVPKMELTEISAVNIGGFISTEVHISKVSEIKPKIKTAVFECRGCMRLHEVEQTCGEENILEPSLCSECGGRSFRFLREDSTFVDSQQVDILKTEIPSKITYPTKLLLEDDLVGKVRVGDTVLVTGTVSTYSLKGDYFKYLKVNNIEILENNETLNNLPEDEAKGRTTVEYKSWHDNVIARDGVCQCCGGHKHLEAHHIYNYKNHPEYRTRLDNGVTLCKWCHGKYHSYYGKEANPLDLIKFFNQFGGKL